MTQPSSTCAAGKAAAGVGAGVVDGEEMLAVAENGELKAADFDVLSLPFASIPQFHREIVQDMTRLVRSHTICSDREREARLSLRWWPAL